MTRRNIVHGIVTLAFGRVMPAAPQSSPKGELLAYIGTYTRTKSKGIYAYRFQPATGDVKEIGLVAETADPSFLVVHPNQKFLYATNEISNYEGQSAGSISAYAIDSATGRLKLLNRVSSKGGGPCHVAMDKDGKWLVVANYGGGSVALYPVKEDGSLGEASAFVQHAGSSANPQRQAAPHAHWAEVTPDSRFVLVCDLGLDQVLVYRLDAAKGTLTPHEPPFAKVEPGAGPRHAALRPDGRFLYVLNEIVPGVTVFSYDAKRGALQSVETVSTLPADYTGNKSGAEIAVHPNGRFVYASNRGPDSIAIFTADTKSGKLTAGDRVPTQGRTPRNFAIDPTGAYLFAANQGSDNIVLFRIDQKTGGLTPAEKTLEVGAPVCIVFAKETK